MIEARSTGTERTMNEGVMGAAEVLHGRDGELDVRVNELAAV